MPDGEVLDLIFTQGFSTRTEVSEVSGRGVGLAVVRSAIDAVGGTVAVASHPGAGTCFTLNVPASISKERNLVVEVGGHLYAIPSRHVRGVVRLHPDAVTPQAEGDALLHDGRLIPLHSMAATVGAEPPDTEPFAVILDNPGAPSAFAVPGLVGEFSLQRRSIDRLAASSSLLCASAGFDDGRLVLILSFRALIEQKRSRVARTKTGAPKESRPKVLAVDDSTIVRDLLAEVLGHAGFDVRALPSSHEGLAALSSDPPDIVLLDVDMPDMDGFELLREIRASSEELPVVMLTTRASPLDRQRAASLGATAYFSKGQFAQTTFIDALRRLVRPRC
jgi:two-component system chemotaxis sensor kinase CheA